MKKLFSIVIALVFTAAVIISCKKDTAALHYNQPEPASLQKDTPYLPAAGHISDTPYLNIPAAFADTPYIK